MLARRESNQKFRTNVRVVFPTLIAIALTSSLPCKPAKLVTNTNCWGRKRRTKRSMCHVLFQGLNESLILVLVPSDMRYHARQGSVSHGS